MKMVVVGILAVMVLGVSGCKSQTVETVIPSETVVVESTEDRFAVNDDLDVGYYDAENNSIKNGVSETLSNDERKALTQDLDGELEAHLDAEAGAYVIEEDYEMFEATIAQMKSEIDSDIFPQEFMDTLEADMAEFWLSGCTDEVYIAEKTVEITDYWNAKYNKPVTKDTTQQQTKPAPKETQAQKPAPKETQAPVKETPKETQAPTQSNNNSGAAEDPEVEAALQEYFDKSNKKLEDAYTDVQGTHLTEDDLNVGVY